jgi:hypothetical protein
MAHRNDYMAIYRKTNDPEENRRRAREASRKMWEHIARVHNVERSPSPEATVLLNGRTCVENAAAKARQRFNERQAAGLMLANGLDPEVFHDLAIIGASYVLNRVATLTDWSKAMREEVGKSLDPYLRKVFVASHKLAVRSEHLQPYIQRLKRDLVKSGIDKREPLIDALHAQAKDVFPDFTRDTIREIVDQLPSDEIAT